MPGSNNKKKHSPKRVKHTKSYKQKAGAESNICSKDINQLLMGNPPVSIGGVDSKIIMKDTIRTAKDIDKYGKSGWGNYPGTPPKPDCVIL